MIKVGSDFSGVGAFDQALMRIGLNYKTIFSCDMDKFARQTYIENYGEPKYYPENVYNREIPKESLDIYMTSPPCQAFSLAGNRKGESEERGVLFYNSHEFIVKNKPRFFIFENVKGLLSDDSGKTFQRWIDYLAKSVNGTPLFFPHEESANYHVYHKVLNSKDYGVPQNRERIFIIGIRDDADNNFLFPPKEHLTKKLKDVLEDEVDEKFFLSDENIDALLIYNKRQVDNNRGFSAKFRDVDKVSTMDALKCGGGGKDDLIKVKSATKRGYETAKEGDSINFSVPSSKTRRGRVGKEVAQTLDTACNQGVIQLNNPKHSNDRVYSDKGCSPILNTMQGGNRQPFVHLSEDEKSDPATDSDENTTEKPCVLVLTPDRLKKRQNGRRFKEDGDPSFTITTQDQHGIYDGFKIRRLTPRECFRLQDFPDSFKMPCSDSQMYKQAGNSITVAVLEKIIRRLPNL